MIPDRAAATTPDPDDLRRLHWLREDLASCLDEIGVIVRRASGEFSAAPVHRVAIEALPHADASSLQAPGEGEGPSMLPPTSITWVWADGTALVYDWQSDVVRATDAD